MATQRVITLKDLPFHPSPFLPAILHIFVPQVDPGDELWLVHDDGRPDEPVVEIKYQPTSIFHPHVIQITTVERHFYVRYLQVLDEDPKHNLTLRIVSHDADEQRRN